MKKLVSILLCACLALSLTAPAMAAGDSAAVQKTVMALGIMTGDENGNMDLSRAVTRAEFTKMLVAASSYKDTVEEGSVSSAFKDVKYTHWASGYIKTAVDAKWATGYVDGTFRPDNQVIFEEAASMVLKLLGYTASDLSGSFPQAQISKFRALKLDKGLTLSQGQALTRNDCMQIFYNLMGASGKSGALYGTTLGHTINSAGEIDYEALVKKDMEGPYVLTQAGLSSILPFDAGKAAVYRNSSLSTAEAVSRYDVVYYNVNAKTVWAYSNRVIGIYTAASPSTVSPNAVTVGGNSYTLDTSAAKSKVSTAGQFAIGDTVALLLGMDGTVVDVIAASAIDGSYYGIITKVELVTYAVDASRSKSEYLLSVACTDGVIRQCAVADDSYKAGHIVSASYAKGELTVRTPSTSSLSGTFSSDGKRLGSYALAADVEILDVSKTGDWVTLYPSRLAGAMLESGSVRFSLLNEKGEISKLILNDVTGDL